MAGWLRTFFCFTMNKSEIKKILMDMCADEINLVYELIRTEYKHVSTDKNANHKIIHRESCNCCINCNSTHIVKNGKTKTGVQKFICVDCHKSQSSTTNTVLYSTKRSYVDWVLFLKCELKEYTLREIANEIGISLRTAFYWRHKLYKSIEKYVNSINVSGNIQIDSTYEKINLKGTKPKNMPRPSKKRGNDSDGKRGISRLKVCIVTAVDDYDNIVMKVAGVGRETIENYNIIKHQIKKPELMITDQAWGFTSFAKECGCQLDQIPFGAYVTDKGNNINTLNGLHKEFNEFIDKKHGVSIKHLQGYLNMFIFKKTMKYKYENNEIVYESYLNSLVTKIKQTITDIKNRVIPIDMNYVFSD